MNDIDVTKIKATGPWVLVKPEEPKKMSAGGLYLPDGNLFERLGHTVGRVVSAGPGYWEIPEGKTKRVFVQTEIKPGDRVVFRGHLQDANRVGKDHCFMHIRDLIGTLEEGAELDLSLPHND